jgi:hypothetical protein
MYIPGNIFYFKPFYFPEGGSKPKYFITLYNNGDSVIVAALPSSQDYVPAQVEKKHGCLNYPEGDFNAYYFSPQLPITTDGWSFPVHTFIYGNWIKSLDLGILEATYQVEGVDYEIIGRLTPNEYDSIVQCLLTARTLRNKVRRLLEIARY